MNRVACTDMELACIAMLCLVWNSLNIRHLSAHISWVHSSPMELNDVNVPGLLEHVPEVGARRETALPTWPVCMVGHLEQIGASLFPTRLSVMWHTSRLTGSSG